MLWHVRVMFVPLGLPNEPDTISLEEDSFVATAVNMLRCASSGARKGGRRGCPLTLCCLTTIIVVVLHRQPLSVLFYTFIQQI